MRALCLTVGNPFDPVGSRQVRVLRRPARVRSLAAAGHGAAHGGAERPADPARRMAAAAA